MSDATKRAREETLCGKEADGAGGTWTCVKRVGHKPPHTYTANEAIKSAFAKRPTKEAPWA